jgi:DNA-binding PadR family transcriptional regulator
MTGDEIEQIQFRAWKAEKEEQQRKRGAYWISPEGREEIRSIWGPEDGSTVWPLFEEVERLEAALAASEARAAFLLRAIDDHKQQPWARLYRAEYDRMVAAGAKGGRDGDGGSVQ